MENLTNQASRSGAKPNGCTGGAPTLRNCHVTLYNCYVTKEKTLSSAKSMEKALSLAKLVKNAFSFIKCFHRVHQVLVSC
jgi:hypothetical protein